MISFLIRMQPRLLLTFLTMLTGCAQFHERPLNPVDSVMRLEARTLDSAGLRHFIHTVGRPINAWSLAAWDLDKLTLAAMYYHPDLAIARAQAEITDAATITAAQHPNPNITLSPTWISNLATTAVPWIAASSLSIPIETAGKRGFRINKSDHLTEAAHLRIADTVWLVRGRLRLAMLDVYAAQETVRLLQQQVGIEQTINQHLQQQQAAGEIAYPDVLSAQLALNQAQLNLTAAQKKRVESKSLLAAAIGVPVDALVGIELDFVDLARLPDLDNIPVARLKEIALRERSDVQAALADYAASQSALQLEIANQYPNIQANPGYTWEMGEHRWVLGATALQLPILHQNQGLIAEAEAKRQESAVRFEGLQLRILGEIDRACAGILAVRARWDASEQLEYNRQDNLRSARALLQAGELDAHGVAVAELEQSVAERARMDVLIESQQILALLEAALRYPMTSAFAIRLLSTSALKTYSQKTRQ